MIVVDTNVIGYLFLTSNQSLLAEKAFQKDPEWVAPILWRSELRNVLALYVRKKIIKLEQAWEIMHNALDLLRGREYEVASNMVLSLAAESKCSAYDCEFVSIANDLKIPLVTVDQQLIRAFPKIAVSLEKFSQNA